MPHRPEAPATTPALSAPATPDAPELPAATADDTPESGTLSPVDRLNLDHRLIVDAGTVGVVTADDGRCLPVVCDRRPTSVVEGRLIAIIPDGHEPPVDAVVLERGDVLAVPTTDERVALLAVEDLHCPTVPIRANHGAGERTQIILAEAVKPTVAAMHRGRMPLYAPLAEAKHCSRTFERWSAGLDADAALLAPTRKQRWLRGLLGFVLGATLAAMLLLLMGCSGTPTERWQRQVEVVTAINHSVIEARTNGWIDDDELRVILPPLAAVNQHLDVAETQLPEGGMVFERRLALARQLLAIVRQTLEPLGIQAQTDRNAAGTPP